MTDRRQEIIDRHTEMRKVRSLEEPDWRDIALVLAPNERIFDTHATGNTRRDDSNIYDATPLYALDDFVGGLFSQATNPANRWFELTLIDKDLAKWQPVKRWLWSISNLLYASFTEAVSSFYSEVPAWFANIGAFGMGAMYDEERVGMGRIIDRSIPIGEIFIDTDAEGNIDRVHREFSLTGRQAERKFKQTFASCRADARYVFIHAVYPNDDYRPGMLGPRGMSYESCYVSTDLRDVEVPGAYYELPYQVPRWTKRSGRPYPTGPGHIARADMVMLNEMERSHIVAGQFAAEPPVLVHDRSKLRASDIEPNSILYGTMNAETGKRTIDILERKQQLTLSMAQSEQRRNAIRTAFKYGIMQLVQRPQMTATEFLGFQEETLKLMGPNLVRTQTDGLSPKIGRRYRMLERAGQFQHLPPPVELQGQPINVEYVSPLAKMLKVSAARGTMQWVEGLGRIAELSKDLSVFDNVNKDEVATVLHDGFVADPNVLADPRMRDQARAQRAAMQKQQMDLANAERAAAVTADMSHAAQAKSLADRRQTLQ